MDRATLGKAGEALAAYWLACLEYQIVARNVFYPSGEIDLVCRDEADLVFVEVRVRSATALETPAESIDRRKQQCLYRAALTYLSENHGFNQSYRFDLVEIVLTSRRIHLRLLPHFLTIRRWW